MSKKLEYVPCENNENLFSSHDMGMVSALISVGYKLLTIEKGRGQKALFIFETTDELIQDAQKYWAGELEVDAQKYFNSIKSVKNQLYST